MGGRSAAGRDRGNLRWALLSAALVVGLFVTAATVSDNVGATGERIAYGVLAFTVLLAPVALVWLVGELHLRWSPRGRLARAVVGWTLTALCLTLLVACAPFALYILILSLGSAFGQ